MKKDILLVLLVGLLLRFIIAPFTLNWDLWANTRVENTFLETSLKEFYKEPLAAYPPLLYLFKKSILIISAPLLPSTFKEWLALPEILAAADPRVFQILFILKLPAIAADLLLGLLLSKLVGKAHQVKVLFLWMLNPLVLYLIPGWTNIDIYPMLAVVASMYMLKKDRYYAAAFLLGIGASLKMFPLFILPFYLLLLPNMKTRILGTIAVVMPIIIVHLPVMHLSEYWARAVTGGYSGQFLFSILTIGKERSIIIALAIYTILFLFAIEQKQRTEKIIFYYFLPFIPFFILSAVSLQWFLWILPFLTVYAVLTKEKIWIGLLCITYVCFVLLAQPTLNIGMLSPIEPTFWRLSWVLKVNPQFSLIINIVQTAFSVLILWIGYKWYKEKINI